MTFDPPSRALADVFDEALELLRDYSDTLGDSPVPAEPLPSLLEQCETALAEAAGPEPLRTVHHFACTGGTLFSKSLFALPNTVLLSEIDPLSEMVSSHQDKPTFSPTDLIFALRHSIRPVDDETIIATFLEGLAAAKTGLEATGRRLILRDHAHSQFCQDSIDFDARPTLLEMAAGRFETRSVVTMRHPLDSFLSLSRQGWVEFTPPTLSGYAERYLAFLDRYEGVPVVYYEDLCTNPDAVLQEMCTHLDLEYSPITTDLIGVVQLSGDSGRGSAGISPRPRRPVPEEIEVERHENRSYMELCQRFGYAP